ncbi:MAG: response regulator [Clostridia bacterium]|nr:response regulator [Clostridia bacterium]
MTAYIIIYSIVMFLLAAAAVAVCVILIRSYKVKADKAVAAAKTEKDTESVFVRAVGESPVSAYVLLDAAERRCVYASRNIEKFFGATSSDFLTDAAAYKKHTDKKYVREFESVLAKFDGESMLEQKFAYGENRFAKAEAFATQSGGRKYILFAVRDVTAEQIEKKQMQKELDSALEQAAAKSSFLSSMSHEIRTPMNGVMGMMSLARMNIDDSEKVMNYLERAGDLSVFLLGMINDILDISKIESGKMQLFSTQFDIFAFAEKIRNMFHGTITGKGVAFDVETSDFTVRYFIGDELRLTQVITNLVSNANKFTPAGGSIKVTFKQLDLIGGRAQIMMRVRDTGKGIAPENIRKIMRPFEQEEASTAHNYGGTGLGLAICDKIVRMMDGNIVIDSTLGKGSDFSVFLSLDVADVKQDLEKAVEKQTPSESVDFKFDSCRILLAEDNEVNAEIAVEILESEGAKVTLARDGVEAVDIFTESKPDSFDIILLDIQMPRLDGRGAARQIRACGRKDALTVPIVALSADAFVEDIKLSEAAGMDGHVSKPIDFDELRRTAGEIIAAKKASAAKDKKAGSKK